jgi:hypothetical protein
LSFPKSVCSSFPSWHKNQSIFIMHWFSRDMISRTWRGCKALLQMLC